jgi:hypothetical protein
VAGRHRVKASGAAFDPGRPRQICAVQNDYRSGQGQGVVLKSLSQPRSTISCYLTGIAAAGESRAAQADW